MPSRPDFFLVNPVSHNFVISDRFNAPREYVNSPTKKQLHEGVDIRAIDSQGKPVAVLAAQRGIVDQVGFSQHGYGNYVRIVHRWGSATWVTWYGHLSATTAQIGQFVLPGQKIGVAGTTGFSTGVHLHLTLQHLEHGLQNYVVDDVVDPEPFFNLGPAPKFDESWYLADVTVEDGTVMQPGQIFRKVWRVRNSGSTTWDAGYQLIFVGQHQMSGPNAVALSQTPVLPGQMTNVEVDLTAPNGTGPHHSLWQLGNADGDTFPVLLFTEIEVEKQDAVDRASFVADVTVEDGSIILPEKTFVKTWRIRNTGTTTWRTQYTLRFVDGVRMQGPDAVPLPQTVKPGEVSEISVNLTAPAAPGRHRSTWALHNAAGEVFDYKLFAEIQVPKLTLPTAKLSEARYIADVTVPDYTEMQPGEKFTKTWRIRNSGESTWGEGYTLAFFADDQMGGPDSVPLPAANPGDVVEVSVPLVAPQTAGSQRSTWKTRDAQSKFFEFDLFALIEVAEVEQPAPQLNEMMYVADVTVPDGTVFQPGEKFVKTWRVRNTGTTPWAAGYSLAFFDNEKMAGPDKVALPPAEPGEIVDISLMLTAPMTSGLHKSSWKGRDKQEKFFEAYLFALIDVVDPLATYDMLSFLRGDGRLYDLQFNWAGGGSQRVQTQRDGHRFYHVKFHEWEEMWADEHFIYRGTDTSPGGGEVYTLTESGKYGSPWIPRHMTVGVPFRRTPLVVFRRKSDGSEVPGKKFVHTTWIQLDAVHRTLKLSSGIELNDVAILAAFEDVGGQPKLTPFERYFYAQKHGLVAWEGSLGQSVMTHAFLPGGAPDNTREVLHWLI